MKDNAEFKDVMHKMAREAAPGVFARLVEELHATGDINGMLRYLEYVNKMTGIEADKKADPNSALPVFNFVFNNGGIHAVQVVQAQPQDEPIEVIDVPALEVSPSPQVSQTAEIVEPPTFTPAPTGEELDGLLGFDD